LFTSPYYTKHRLEYGDKILTAEILPEGIPAIKKLGEYLKGIKTDYNAMSGVLRVRQTVEIIQKISGKKFVEDKRLHELMEPPNGTDPSIYPYTETLEDMTKRVQELLNEVVYKKYENVLLGTHGGVIATLKHLIVEEYFERRNLYDFPPPNVLTIIKDKNIEEIDFNTIN